MNPLGSLPGASSTPGTLNTLDWQKILRALLVQLISAFVVLAPKLAGMTYIYKGTDYTPAVLIVINGATEAGRRLLTGVPKQ